MNSGSHAKSNEKDVEARTHDIPIEDAMIKFMKEGWAALPLNGVTSHPSIPYTKLRRDKLLEQYLGKRIVAPSSSLKVRGNDSDYQFRADSAFSWSTGIVAINFVLDSLFVMEPNELGHEISYYFFTFNIGSYS